jgi:hypothetical protein
MTSVRDLDWMSRPTAPGRGVAAERTSARDPRLRHSISAWSGGARKNAGPGSMKRPRTARRGPETETVFVGLLTTSAVWDGPAVPKKRWKDLSPRARQLILVGGVCEGLLKTAALIDLARRPAHRIRGKKRQWTIAIVLINSAGIVPIAYFAYGRLNR